MLQSMNDLKLFPARSNRISGWPHTIERVGDAVHVTVEVPLPEVPRAVLELMLLNLEYGPLHLLDGEPLTLTDTKLKSQVAPSEEGTLIHLSRRDANLLRDFLWEAYVEGGEYGYGGSINLDHGGTFVMRVVEAAPSR